VSGDVSPYLRLQIGTGKKAFKLRTSVVKHSGGYVTWPAEETLTVQLIDPGQWIQDSKLLLRVEVWDDRTFGDAKLCEGEVDILDVFGLPTVCGTVIGNIVSIRQCVCV
jgi:hypothetical protein